MKVPASEILPVNWPENPDCMYIIDANAQRTLSINRPIWKNLGYHVEEVQCPQAAIPQQFLHKDDTVLVKDFFAHLLGLGESGEYRRHLRFLARNGNWQTYCLRIVYQDFQRKHFLGIITDISPEKSSFQRLKNKLAAVNSQYKFVEGEMLELCHDIRSPLQTMQLLTQQLDNLEWNDENSVVVQKMRSTAALLNDTVTSVLARRRVKLPTPRLAEQVTDIRSIIDQVECEASVRLQASEVVFKVEVAPSVPTKVGIEGGKIYQLLINLVINSIKHTKSGFIDLTCNYDNTLGSLEFRIRDSGTGMTKRQLTNIQRPLVSYSEDDGIGMGLHICSTLLKQVNGTFVVESAPGQGTTVTASIPAEIRDEGGAHIIGEKAPIGNFNILVVDDDPFCLSIMSLFAASLGGECTAIDNIYDTESVILDDFDLILVDNRMPEATGQLLVNKFRRRGYNGPVYILSADQAPARIAADCTGWIEKPLACDQLRAIIGHSLNEQTHTNAEVSKLA